MEYQLVALIILISLLSAYIQSTPTQAIKDELEIRNKLALYAVAIDSQDWDTLDEIFTPNIVANYHIPDHEVLHGLPAVKSFVVKQLTGTVVQHTVDTIVVEPRPSPTGDIKSTSYVVANTLGQGKLGEAAFVFGKFFDTWTKSNGKWKVKNRVFELFVSCFPVIVSDLVFANRGSRQPPGITGNKAVMSVKNY